MSNNLIMVLKDKKIVANVTLCESAESRRTGLLKTSKLDNSYGIYSGILMVIPEYRRKFSGFINSIHMIGMKYPIFVAWLNDDKVITDACLAEPGFHIYSPKQKATYIIELNVEASKKLYVGDKLELEDITGKVYTCSKNQK